MELGILNILIGKTISSVYITDAEKNYIDNNESLLFKSDKDYFLFKCDGSCCSEAWIESIDNIKNIIGYEILCIEEKSMRIPQENSEATIITLYRLRTEKGYADIEFRTNQGNDSCGQLYRLDDSMFSIKQENEENKTKTFIEGNDSYIGIPFQTIMKELT